MRTSAYIKSVPERPGKYNESGPSTNFMFSMNRNTQKNMQLLDKIHTVFTAALTVSLKAVLPVSYAQVIGSSLGVLAAQASGHENQTARQLLVKLVLSLGAGAAATLACGRLLGGNFLREVWANGFADPRGLRTQGDF